MRIFGILALAAAGCASDAPDEAAQDAAFFCSGTEPFWSLSLSEGEAVLREVTMAPEPVETKFSGGWASLDESSGEYVWRDSQANEEFEVTITRATCRGTRDEPYAYQSSLGTNRANGVFEPGCCDRR